MLQRHLIIILFVCLSLTACTNVFFQPLQHHLATPDQYDIEYEDIYFKGASGLKLHGWWFPSPEESKACVLFLHGNAENVSTHSGLVYWLTQHQYDVFVFDYRGYGNSEGIAEIAGIMEDIQSGREYIESRKPESKKLFILGHSLGASMGIYNLAIHPDKVDGMILVSPFSDYRQVARETMSKSWLTWAFQWPISITIDNSYSPIDYVHLLPKKPKLFMYALNDEIIDPDHVIELYEKAVGEKVLSEVNGYHNTLFSDKENQQIILRYLDQWSE